MKNFLSQIIVFLLICSGPLLANSGLVPISEVTDNISCNEFFIAQEFLTAKYVRENQKPYYKSYIEEAKRAFIREEAASGSLYTSTANYHLRQTEWPAEALSVLKTYTGWTAPLGVSYSKQKNTTTIIMPGDPELVSQIKVRLYDSAKSDTPLAEFSLEYDSQNKLLWKIDLPGNFEGKWYDFEYKSQPGAISYAGKPIPETYIVIDPVAYKVAFNKTQIWYPPLLHNRPDLEKNTYGLVNGSVKEIPSIILEIELSDMSPPDVNENLYGSAEAVIKSKILKKILESFTTLELMPVRNSSYFEGISSNPTLNPSLHDVVYTHWWGYQPTLWSISNAKGGPDGIFSLIDEMHKRNISIRKDAVVQHLSNRTPSTNDMLTLFHFALKNIFRPYDITGCGNTTNLDLHTIYSKIVFQMMIRDLMIFKFNGHRYDLMGAIPRNTAEYLKRMTFELNANISGEPYAGSYNQSEWNTEHNPLRDSGLWDHHYRNEVRHIAKYGAKWQDLIKWIGGGSLFTWVHKSTDRTAILETHDGQTLANYLNGDYHKIANALSMLLSTQGSVLIGASQIAAINHPHLDDTPIDIFNLSKAQKTYQEFALNLIKLRKKYNAYFGYQWLEENRNVMFIKTENKNSIGLHFKKPAFGQQKEEIIILFNLSNTEITFKIPKGSWKPLADTAALKADPNQEIYPPAHDGTYTVKPFSSIWLVK